MAESESRQAKQDDQSEETDFMNPDFRKSEDQDEESKVSQSQKLIDARKEAAPTSRRRRGFWGT